MCGITGWVDWEEDLTRQTGVVEAMTAALVHRGPDGAGVWVSSRAALGHRRLVVIDPEGGAQPMVRQWKGRTFVISYNGELYNTAELRAELVSRGYTFTTRSDTEVLLLSYVEWGAGCLERLNGIFAFAVWDDTEQSLFLARDRLGVKPLFFTIRGQAFIFASEIKSLLRHPYVKPEVDMEGLAEVFALGPARTPGNGVFRGVHELKAGHYLIHDRKSTKERPYWRLKSDVHHHSLASTIETVRDLLADAVERQLVSDVPVCTLLSGGLDSSALTALAARAFTRNGRGRIHTYSVDYEGNDVSFTPNQFEPDADRPWVARVSGYLNTRHHYVIIKTNDLASALQDAMQARDLPGMADIDASLLLFCREIKKEATVALSGECADEVFGGYPWFFQQDALKSDTFPWSRFVSQRRMILAPDLADKIKPEEYARERYRQALSQVPRLEGEGRDDSRMREMFYLNLTRWMPTLLDRKDRMSMAAGLEVRVPFCDHRLVEYLWNTPWAYKACDGRAKGLLRRAMEGILPPDVLGRRKSPYPKTHNPAYAEAVRLRLREILSDKSSPLLPLINVDYVRVMTESDLRDFDAPWFGQLMRGPQMLAYLVQVDMWLREYRIVIR